VVCNVGKDLRTAGVAARLSGIPVVHRVGLPGDMRNVPKVRMLHAFIKPRLLVPCEFIKFGLRENLPWLKDEEITVIRTGKPCAGEETPPPDGPLRLVATSQLNPDKGHDDLLRALARLAEEGYAFRLDVLGTGSEEERLKELGRELGLDERLTWHGFQRNVRAFLLAADVFVLPSRSEGLPNTLLEAMALGLAPVARDVGGVREIWPEAMDFLLADARGGGEGMYPPLKRVLDAPPDELAGYKRIALNVCRERFDQQTQARRVAEWLAGLN
jgi:glycosyltransferase involved in cell wall biosynthesis